MTLKLDNGHVQEIIELFSKERLQTYYNFIKGPQDHVWLTIFPYLTMQQATALMYPSIHLAEVCLRNRIDCTLQSYFRSHPDKITDEGGTPSNWYDWAPFDERILDKISDAKGRARIELKNRIPQRGDIISRITFATWVSMFEEIVKDRSDRYIVREIAHMVFPNYQSPKLDYAIDRLHSIRKIRNRLFHHEPIWTHDRVRNLRQAHERLVTIHKEILGAIKWISPKIHSIYTEEWLNFDKTFEGLIKDQFEICDKMCKVMKDEITKNEEGSGLS